MTVLNKIWGHGAVVCTSDL